MEAPQKNAVNFRSTFSPVSGTQRLESIDVLRGFAVLGILIMNIQSFSMIGAAYSNPTAYGNLEGLNYVVWYASHLFADLKFMGLFSMLFGAGIILMTERREAKELPTTGFHYRRLFWLLIFGLVHAYCFWYGDILVTYAMTGAIIYWARRMSPRWMIFCAFIMLSVASILSILFGWSMPHWSEAQLSEFDKQWAPRAEVVEHELEMMRGTWLEQMQHRAPVALMLETFIFAILLFWRAGGLMLLGMALFKMRILDASRSRKFYTTMMLTGFLVGLPAIAYGIYQNNEHDWSVTYSFFYGTQFNYWGSVAVALGYVGMIMLACKSKGLRWLTSRLARTGQMAFTNYLSQSLLCTLLFYGHGMGWFGSVSRIQQLCIAIIILATQIAFSNWWLTRFRFGPMEWLWRSLTYWKWQANREANASCGRPQDGCRVP